MNPQPTTAGERVIVLDVIRGFALLGILLMNIEYFQRPMQAIMLGFDWQQEGIDRLVALFVFAFVQGKFYTMFSLLFGLGFVIFLDRARARGASARLLFARRLAVLAVFGVLHAFFIWTGDILLLYAGVGFLLLLFVNTPPSRLWKWGLGFFLVPVALMWLGALAVTAAMQDPATAADLNADFTANRVALMTDLVRGEIIYTTGSFLEVACWRLHEWTSMYLGGGVFFFVPMVLGMFLVGAALGRAGVFHDLGKHAGLLRKFVVIGYLVGIPAAVYWGMYASDFDMMQPSIRGAVLMTVGNLSSIALCLAYIGTLALLVHRGNRWVMYLAPAGRMALTNYLMHSVVFTLLFYGYGLGLWGSFGRAAATLAAITLYWLQLRFSAIWLANHAMGPMEAVWRRLTYGKSAA